MGMRNENEKWEQSYELKKKINELSNEYIIMNYYRFNRQKILRKAKEKYSKEKPAEYYKRNKEAIKEKWRERYKNLSQEEKDRIKEYQKIYIYQELVQYKKDALKNK